MNSLSNVVRYHLINRLQYVLMPWGILAFVFAVNAIIFAVIAPPAHGGRTGSLASIFVVMLALGIQCVVQLLPFGLALGQSRRAFYLGTVTLVAGMAVVYGLVLAILQEVERATRGWGLHMSFFRVGYILNGPWYETWLTASVGLLLLFIYGMWFGLVFRRWNLVGLFLFIAAQITVLLGAALAVTWAHAWSGSDHFFSSLSAPGLTGVLAGLGGLLALGGLSTMRRVTV